MKNKHLLSFFLLLKDGLAEKDGQNEGRDAHTGDYIPTISKNSYMWRLGRCVISQISTNYCVYQLGTKTLQTLHKTLHFLCISLILRTLYCVGFEAKILHKPYMKPYMGTKSQRD